MSDRATTPGPEREPLLRIGELSRRTGVGIDTLRAWERRYGLLRPQRSSGGFRLYDAADEERVRAMKSLIGSGASAAEAARLAVSRQASYERDSVAEHGDVAKRLVAALDRFDEADANALLDDSIARFTVDTVAGRILLPVMQGIGSRWESGEISVAEEHFATALLRARMLALGRNWGAGRGPLALLACPPGELHDLGLIAFGLMLRERGWRIAFLGAETPIETISDAAERLGPDVVALAAVTEKPFRDAADRIRTLAASSVVLIGGEGASDELAQRLGVRALARDPIEAATHTKVPR